MSQRVLFTADTHFGHQNIIRFCNRPFRDIDEHDEVLIANWNAAVQPGDVVWHLGDFGYRGDNARLAKNFDRLNGVKNLIIGNHDRPFVREKLPWNSVEHMADIVVDGRRLILSHYAMRVWPAMRRGVYMLFGHSHTNLAGNAQSCDVGVDAFQYRPVTLDEIRAHLDTLPPITFSDRDDEVFEPEVIPAPIDPNELDSDHGDGWKL
ncbi:MAG: hypothetical protein ABS76_36850 [Pelagibacterium sp. SCN 64-44]|jgi:calcineurin-like phosphoesterase family protein|nr:MAG: hypothetical protein ABS76_36850 [Pelagibacterium sp. SCN 64-44]